MDNDAMMSGQSDLPEQPVDNTPDSPGYGDPLTAPVLQSNAHDNAPESLPELPYDDPLHESPELGIEPTHPVYQSRIEKLTAAIAKNPIAPANYVYRAEAYLDERDFFHAETDFRQAKTLAIAQQQTSNWGYIYSALVDRAREGLRRMGLQA